MTAASPYAPAARNLFLNHTAGSERSSGDSSSTAIASVGFILFVFRFWERIPMLRQLCGRLPEFRFDSTDSIQKIVGYVKMWGLKLLLSRTSSCNGKSKKRTGAPDNHPCDSGNALSPLSSNKKSTNAASLLRVQENLELIQLVLKYWFGQNAPDQSQKKLWMIAAQSTALRQKIDEEIADKFTDVLKELVIDDGNDDNTSVGEKKSGMRWKEWCHNETCYGYQGKMAAIVVLDQFSRHIHRYYLQQRATLSTSKSMEMDTSDLMQQLPPQSSLDCLALETAELLVQNHASEFTSGMIPIPMHVFALMPFRHASTKESVRYVQEQVEEVSGIIGQCDSMLRRFRKATNRRMAVLQDSARRKGEVPHKTKFTDEDILECSQFDADFTATSTALDHIVTQTILAFLQDNISNSSLLRALLRNTRQRQQKNRNDSLASTATPIFVSLSGGVDSMVILRALVHLVQVFDLKLEITALHIDYGNRPESSAEASFLHRYCEQLGVAYRCRRIDEVTRGVTARDDYERIARQVRYSFYRQAVDDSCPKEASDDLKDNIGIILGHHRGDLRENVLSNAHKGCGPLDLSGMTSVSRNDGVTLFRPLLAVEKTLIYDYAHQYGVPYFKDTTPHWSTRGKLRNKLLPLLEEIYGEGSMNNLSDLAVESDACRALFRSVALGPFLEQVQHFPMGIRFATAEWKSQTHFFWKFVLRETLHAVGLGMFSDKSALSFMKRIQSNKILEGWLQCRKDFAVYLRKDGQVYVFYPNSFPWRKSDAFNCTGEPVQYDEAEAREIGPWRVSSSLLNLISTEGEFQKVQGKLGHRALVSMDNFMQGFIEYYLLAPTWLVDGCSRPRALVFTKFTKATRPQAWKNSNLKIQETLPLLGNDEIATGSLPDHHSIDDKTLKISPLALIKVTLTRAQTSAP